ncbi:hypothetical protein AVEN_118297-1 [Araneus ventricosus]|uniref:Uncharacterized protein n=1 Tax=Araneus ventricosus TaxID=182803 RepID=A0A4Y2I847_ARAVE|nr:hypothetical protein AVEN_118297-1 [Araneus ventricosus]
MFPSLPVIPFSGQQINYSAGLFNQTNITHFFIVINKPQNGPPSQSLTLYLDEQGVVLPREKYEEDLFSFSHGCSHLSALLSGRKSREINSRRYVEARSPA